MRWRAAASARSTAALVAELPIEARDCPAPRPTPSAGRARAHARSRRRPATARNRPRSVRPHRGRRRGSRRPPSPRCRRHAAPGRGPSPGAAARRCRPVAIGHAAQARDRAEPSRRQICAGQDRKHARRGRSSRGVDAADAGMRVRRAQHHTRRPAAAGPDRRDNWPRPVTGIAGPRRGGPAGRCRIGSLQKTSEPAYRPQGCVLL